MSVCILIAVRALVLFSEELAVVDKCGGVS